MVYTCPMLTKAISDWRDAGSELNSCPGLVARLVRHSNLCQKNGARPENVPQVKYSIHDLADFIGTECKMPIMG